MEHNNTDQIIQIYKELTDHVNEIVELKDRLTYLTIIVWTMIAIVAAILVYILMLTK